MSSVGRGRGRGRGAYIIDAKRPGSDVGDHAQPTLETPSSPKRSSEEEKNDSAEHLASMVKTLSVGSSADLHAISEAAKKYSLTEGKHEEAVLMIYRRCYEDWRMSSTAAKICSSLVLEIGNQFRTALLTSIQKDFKRKNELRQCFPSNFLGCMSFLCQVFAQMKVGENKTEPFLPLIGPVYEALETMLDSDANDLDMECAVTQIYAVGKLLQEHGDSNKYRELMRTVKNKILDSKGSRNVRKLMIDLIECSASDWTLPSPVQA